MFFLRHSTLVIEYLRRHPQAKDPEAKRAIKPLLKRMPTVINQLEEIKPEIARAHEEWLKISAAQKMSPSTRRYPAMRSMLPTTLHCLGTQSPLLRFSTRESIRISRLISLRRRCAAAGRGRRHGGGGTQTADGRGLGGMGRGSRCERSR